MFDGGAIDEAEALLARNLDPDLPAMRAIGVPQIAAHLRGETTRDEALEQAQAATRQYAKRQYTWFRHQPPGEDRKSVVSGKSVSVRVDLGGRRVIKTKKKHKHSEKKDG